MRKYLSIIIGIVVIALGILAFWRLNSEDNAKDNAQTKKSDLVGVKTTFVELQNMSYIIEATGTLQAKEKIELYSEVQGILQKNSMDFKIGNRFRKGQVLVSIDSREHAANIKSTRSDLVNQIAAMLPDMEMDYPNDYKKWEAYLQHLDINSTTPPLPLFSSNEEKLFISGKSIYRTYYNIKNLEERLSKYYIKAPFNGIVTESNVNTGSLIRSGQKIGEYIDNSKYELQLSIPASENKFLSKGTSVRLETMDGSQEFAGKITRVNGKIDRDTQSVDIIVEVIDKDLKDGQYLKARIEGDNLNDVFRIDNVLILENKKIYVVEENILQLQSIEVLNYQGDTALISGLENGTVIVNQSIANAYPGMPIKVIN